MTRHPTQVTAKTAQNPIGNRSESAHRSSFIADRRAVDLRRRHSREFVELLLARSDFLPVGERTLVRAIYAERSSVADVARMLDQPVNTVRARVRRIARRALSPGFAFVALHRDAMQPTMKRVATACVLHGLPLRAAARQLGISLHAVRRQRDALFALAQAPLGMHTTEAQS